MHKKRNRKINRRNLKNTFFQIIEKNTLKQIVTKAICILLIVNILTISTPAAPATLIGTAGEISQDIRFGFFSGKWAVNFPAFLGAFVKSSGASQNENISRIQIYPGSVTIKKGEKLVFSAVGFDSQDEPLSGVEFDWRVTDSENRFPPRKFQGGIFKSGITGTFTVTAKSRGRKAEVTVIVKPSAMQNSTQTAQSRFVSTEISSRSIKSSKRTESEIIGDEENQSSNQPSTDILPDDGGWGSGN